MYFGIFQCLIHILSYYLQFFGLYRLNGTMVLEDFQYPEQQHTFQSNLQADPLTRSIRPFSKPLCFHPPLNQAVENADIFQMRTFVLFM